MASSSGRPDWKGKENELLEQFIGVTGASKDVGERLLDACNGNLDMAIGMFMDGNGAEPDPGPSTSASSGSAGHARGGAEAMPGASLMDEELDVRAPIPQKKEVLMEENYPAFAVRSAEEAELERLGFRGHRRRAARSVFDGFRDFEAETRQQSEWAAGSSRTKKRKTLEDLFRPPLELMHKGTFHSARDIGTKTNRWLIVNIQNVQEFCCQALNRDVWSQPAVKSIIQEHFIFWQVYHDSEEGKRYTQFYKINEWPYIAILDPRTGENLAIWNKMDALTFCDNVTEFLTNHPSLDANSPPKKKQRVDSIVEASEDSQMEAAIRASLEAKEHKTFQLISDSEAEDELETFTDSESDNDNIKDDAQRSQSSNNKVKDGGVKTIDSNKSKGTSSVKNSKLSGAISKSDVAQSKTFVNSIMKDSKTSSCASSAPSPSKSLPSSAGTSFVSEGEKPTANNHVSDSCSAEKNGGVTGDEVNDSEKDDSWKEHLGKDDDPKTTLMIRFPDGKREQVNWPCSSTLFALVQFVVSKGFTNERYELVTNFPRRQLSYMDFDNTLKQIGLHPQETVFVQER